jgi:type I restriction enzyme R subunit
MAFNELNSVEHYIINKLSGVNLNNTNASEPDPTYGKFWKFKSAEVLGRSVNEVLLENEVKDALVRLNPDIKARPELPD